MLQERKASIPRGGYQSQILKRSHPLRGVPERSGLDSGVLPGKSIKISKASAQLHASIMVPAYGMFSR